MNSEDTAQLVVNLSDALWNCPAEATTDLSRATLCRAIIPLLAQGQPVSLAQVAAAVSRSEDEVSAVLNRHMNIEYYKPKTNVESCRGTDHTLPGL